MSSNILLTRLASDCYRHGTFTLSSGRSSDHYVNCKPLALSGSGLALLSPALLDKVEPEAVAVGGLTLGADPLVSGVAMAAAQAVREIDVSGQVSTATGNRTSAAPAWLPVATASGLTWAA